MKLESVIVTTVALVAAFGIIWLVWPRQEPKMLSDSVVQPTMVPVTSGLTDGTRQASEATINSLQAATGALARSGGTCEELADALRRLRASQRELDETDPASAALLAERGPAAVQELVRALEGAQADIERCRQQPGFVASVEAPP